MHLSQHPATGRPAQTLTQAIEEPQAGEDGHGGGAGEEHIDASHHEQANGEEPAGADLVREHAADELADGVGQGLAAGDHSWSKGKQIPQIRSLPGGTCSSNIIQAYSRAG